MGSFEAGESLTSLSRSRDPFAWPGLVSVYLVLTLTLAPRTGLLSFTRDFTYQSTVRSLSPKHSLECRTLVTQPALPGAHMANVGLLSYEPFHGDCHVKTTCSQELQAEQAQK